MSDPQPTDAFAWTQEPWGRALRCTRLAVPHLFSSRDLMLREDEAEWSAVAASLGVPPGRLRLVKQVHGIDVMVARRGERRSLRSARRPTSSSPTIPASRSACAWRIARRSCCTIP